MEIPEAMRVERIAGFEEGQSAIAFGVLPVAFQTRRHHFGPRCGGAW